MTYLQFIRHDHGLNKKQFADGLGISVQRLSWLEDGPILMTLRDYCWWRFEIEKRLRNADLPGNIFTKWFGRNLLEEFKPPIPALLPTEPPKRFAWNWEEIEGMNLDDYRLDGDPNQTDNIKAVNDEAA